MIKRLVQFIAQALNLNLFVVINKTMSYSSPGEGKRDYVPVGTVVEIIKREGIWAQISGQDPNPWKGKWVSSLDLEPYVQETPPDEEVDFIEVHYTDGTVDRFELV